MLRLYIVCVDGTEPPYCLAKFVYFTLATGKNGSRPDKQEKQTDNETRLNPHHKQLYLTKYSIHNPIHRSGRYSRTCTHTRALKMLHNVLYQRKLNVWRI